MPTVRLWTGCEARALRRALRLSVRAFAGHLGVAPRTVSKWEQLGKATRPHPDTQAILDTALDRADTAAQIRFQMFLTGAGMLDPAVLDTVPAAWEYETWADDLDRAAVAMARQNFTAGTARIWQWLARYPDGPADTHGRYLYARSLVLLGDAHRDQGRLDGPQSAADSYRQALGIFGGLDIPRRVAQIELSLTVVTEMRGSLQSAARGYRRLADDRRLCGRDRARARLWIGTSLSKAGEHDYATPVMAAAAREFEDLGEAEDWAVAQQKLALAYRGAGEIGQAQRLIDLAGSSGPGDTPMQRVRLSTAQAHILLSDAATYTHGLALLDQTATLAVESGLSHQFRAIESIRRQAVAAVS